MKKRLYTWLGIAFLVWFVHDAMLLMGCVMIRGEMSFDAFRSLLWERLTLPGDAERYLQIAKEGYLKEGPDAINLVFYPLYPLLMRVFSLFGLLPMEGTGMVISRLSLAGASIALYELVKTDNDEKSAFFSVLMMAVYPFSMFTVGVYTESLFLFLTIGCMLMIRKDKMVFAGIMGFLAALTRVQGMLLIFPAVYRIVAGRLGGEQRKLRWTDLGVLMIPMGFAVYLMINASLHGNAFQFLLYEEGEPWYQTSRWLGENIALQYRQVQEFKGLEWVIYIPQLVLYFTALAVLFLGIRNGVRMEYLLYGAVYLGFTYLSGWMISGGRYMLCCFPCFIVLSQWKREGLCIGITVLSAGLFVVYSLMFLMGYAIM